VAGAADSGRRMGRILLFSATFLMAAALAAHAAQPLAPIQRQAAEAVARDLKIGAASELIAQSLQVLAPFASLPEGTAMHVISARPDPASGAWLLRLDCVLRRDCLPFHVLLHLPEAEVAGFRLPTTAGPTAAAVPAAAMPGGLVAPIARRGEQVEVVENLSGVRLRRKAVCLESGALGQRIRVRTGTTHRVLLATVAGRNMVKVEP